MTMLLAGFFATLFIARLCDNAGQAAPPVATPITTQVSMLDLIEGGGGLSRTEDDHAHLNSTQPSGASASAVPDAAETSITLTPMEPGVWGQQLSPGQVYGLALFATNDEDWARFARACFTDGRENRGYVGAVGGPNADGSYDLGIGQSNTGTLAGLGVDADAVRRDPVLAMHALYRTYQLQGASAWAGCR